ncbi:hypothetical protein JCGZ_09331 [Jatropha curcas]|uniref:Uncharacterized protein n=1 Tax=Jatropha curcas TaxID=180498 RepID=A0A067KW57_JATCU|nr:hypothetical protein JCGZ_09331 [Jatropha curcas]
MARGRVFDSDTSGSGLRGGRGLGCSTRGSGGTVPPSSSVFTSCTITYCTSFIRSTFQPQFGSGRENNTTAQERLVSSQGESETESRIDEIALYLEAVGGEKEEEELRAHVMRLSGQPGAGTSSFDPAPTTYQNLSTSQQQPLLSPDPDAVDDTLVTPTDTTAHPLGTPPGDSTLDRVEDQPRRFDFGPF